MRKKLWENFQENNEDFASPEAHIHQIQKPVGEEVQNVLNLTVGETGEPLFNGELTKMDGLVSPEFEQFLLTWDVTPETDVLHGRADFDTPEEYMRYMTSMRYLKDTLFPGFSRRAEQIFTWEKLLEWKYISKILLRNKLCSEQEISLCLSVLECYAGGQTLREIASLQDGVQVWEGELQKVIDVLQYFAPKKYKKDLQHLYEFVK